MLVPFRLPGIATLLATLSQHLLWSPVAQSVEPVAAGAGDEPLYLKAQSLLYPHMIRLSEFRLGHHVLWKTDVAATLPYLLCSAPTRTRTTMSMMKEVNGQPLTVADVNVTPKILAGVAEQVEALG